MNINIQRAGEVGKITVEMFEGNVAIQTAADFLEKIQSKINIPSYDPDQVVVTFVAKEKGNVAGLFMAVRQNDTLQESMIVVAPAHRKKGVSERLLDAAKQSGVKAIELTVFPLEEPEQHGKDYSLGTDAIMKKYAALDFRPTPVERSRTMVWHRPE